MRELFDQVGRAADARLYWVALLSALAIPDICASMETTDGLATRARFIAWFDLHVAPRYGVGPAQAPSLNGADAYGLRCSLLHQGRTRPRRGAYSRVLFVEPQGRVVLHNNVLNDALNLDVATFCHDVVDAALAWLVQAEGTDAFQANLPHFMQRYDHGFPPYIAGVSVLT